MAEAYDSLKRSVMLQYIIKYKVPLYMTSWIRYFLCARSLFCSDSARSCRILKPRRDVPQGFVISPQLFNIVMSSLSLQDDLSTVAYADDVEFLACDISPH